MPNTSPHVIIAGAGIGGLTAALALLKSGIDCDVYEQASELREVGAGLATRAERHARAVRARARAERAPRGRRDRRQDGPALEHRADLVAVRSQRWRRPPSGSARRCI